MPLLQTSDYIRVLWRRRWLLLATCLLGALIAFGATRLATKTYVSTTELFVSAQSGGNSQDLLNTGVFLSDSVTSYADVATTPTVLGPAAAKLGLAGGAATLRSSVSATVPQNTVVVQISVSAKSGIAAARRANAVGQSFAAAAPRLVPPTVRGRSPIRITTVTPAAVPAFPSSPNTKVDVVLGLFVGFALGALFVLAREFLDTRVTGVDDVARVTDTPILATVPKMSPDKAHTPALSPSYADGEPYRLLRTNLQFANIDRAAHCIVVTSSLEAEGKSTTATNLAIVLAQAEASVVLVDADLRRSSIAADLTLPSRPGLTDVLIAPSSLEAALQPWGPAGLSVLAAGASPPNPSELLGSSQMDTLLRELRARYEYVIIDTPPLLPVTDAAVLSTKADAVLLVVGCRLARRDHVSQALSNLERVNASVRGVVLNRVSSPGQGDYAYYGTESQQPRETATEAPIVS